MVGIGEKVQDLKERDFTFNSPDEFRGQLGVKIPISHSNNEKATFTCVFGKRRKQIKVDDLTKRRDKESKKLGCPWKVNLRKQKSGKWKISYFHDCHEGHENAQDIPNASIQPDVAERIETLKRAHMKPAQIRDILRTESVTLSLQDVCNIINRVHFWFSSYAVLLLVVLVLLFWVL